MQTTDKIVDGIAYDEVESGHAMGKDNCKGCVACDDFSLCKKLYTSTCGRFSYFKIKDITKKPEAWVTIEGDNGVILRCTEEFREKLINHPKVIAAYEKSIVKEVKHSTSDRPDGDKFTVWSNNPDFIKQVQDRATEIVKSAEQKGVKTDTGKPRYGLIPPFALEQVAICLTEGLKTHPAKDNWKLVEDGKERFLESLERHFQQYKMGEVFDRDEPKVRNLAAVIVNALFALEFEVNPELKGD